MKFKKLLNRVIALSITAISLITFLAGCSDQNKHVVKEVNVWTAPITEKIYQNLSYEPLLKNTVNIHMAKNEYESGQIIITAKDKNINSFDIVKADLVSVSGDKINKEDITIYQQHYINITKKPNRNDRFPEGKAPDGLIPIEVTKSVGENKIDAFTNQGIWIKIKTTKDTQAGVYTGVFTLNFDGNTQDIAVNTTVWNFDVPDEVNTQSCFMLNRNDMMHGELDSSDEMYKLYYETLLDYRISPAFVPDSEKGLNAYIDSVNSYFDKPGFSAYIIPHSSSGSEPDYDLLKQYVKALAVASTEDKNLIEKGYYYIFDILDEPHLDNTGEAVKRLPRIMASCDLAEEKAIEELENEGFFNGKSAEFKDRMIKAIRNIPNIITAPYDEDVADTPLTWCPLVEEWDKEENIEILNSEKERKGSLWWYTCTGPVYPYPTYHIDDNLLGSRILSWMQKAYDIDGNLYWATTTYTKIELNANNEDNISRPTDPYNDPQRMSDPWISNGDGYMFYPGKKYNVKGPFPSIRLESIRDGLEEYEYLNILENYYAQASEFYNTTVSADSVLQNLYSRLFTGAVYTQDYQIFDTTRHDLAKLIEEKVDNPSMFFIENIEQNLNVATVSFLVDSTYNVKVNGQSLTGSSQGNGTRYIYNVSLSSKVNSIEVVVEKDGKSYTFTQSLANEVKIVSDFSAETELSKFIKTDTVTLSIQDGMMQIVAQSKPSQALSYKPMFALKVSELGALLSQVDKLSFKVKNEIAENLELSVFLVTDRGEERRLTTRLIKADQDGFTEISIGKIYQNSWDKLSSVKHIEFRLLNMKNATTPMPEQILLIDDLIIELANKE